MKIDQEKLQQYGHLSIIAKQAVEGFITGLHKSPYHGFSVEFAEHKIYNKGESTRNIDWKLFARTDKLFVKNFEEETNLRSYIILDNSSSMHFPLDGKSINKITFSCYAAAAIIFMLKKQRDASGLFVFADKIETVIPPKSTSLHQKLIINELEKLLLSFSIETRKQTFASKALHEIADRIHNRSMVIIFSDMFDSSSEKNDDLFSALRHLKYNKHEILLFHVTDKEKELDFEFDNRPYKFVDLESGEEVKIHPKEVKSSYTKAINSYRLELKKKCGQYGIEFIEADINQGFNQVLLPYLIKRIRMS
jgi:uncharacterized protein (DUF58 family)